MREKISLSDKPTDLLFKMSEGNPGALRVCMELMQSGPQGMLKLLDLDDMNLRGSAIWVAYKDHCGEDIDKLVECLKSRDSDMVRTVNNEDPSRAPAVTSGASYDR